MSLPAVPKPTDRSECGPDQPCHQKPSDPWSQQHPDLKIREDDLIGDCDNDRKLLNLCQERGIRTLLYMGVASNLCVQYRFYGVRNMKRHGLQAIVVSDLVEAISANGVGADGRRDDNFTPAKGTAVINATLSGTWLL